MMEVLRKIMELLLKGKKMNAEIIPLMPEDKEIAWKRSPNFSKRNNRKVEAIILHHTGSFNANGELAWMCNPEAKVSAHYLIDREGNITQMVRDEHVAWHAGKSELNGRKYVNNFSVGIELTGDTVKKPLTEDQYGSLIWLVRKLADKYNVDASNIVSHREIAPGRKVDLDPANFNWEKFYADLGAI